jgi:hypothetical protein
MTPIVKPKVAVVSIRMTEDEQKAAYQTAEYFQMTFNDMVKQLLKLAETEAIAQGMTR